MIRIESQNAETLLHVEHLFLGCLYLLFQIVELAREPVGDSLTGGEACLIAALDIGRDDLVDNICGQLGTQRLIADADNLGLLYLRYLQIRQQLMDRFLADSGIVEREARFRCYTTRKLRVVGEIHLARYAEHQRVALENRDLRQQTLTRVAGNSRDGVYLIFIGRA